MEQSQINTTQIGLNLLVTSLPRSLHSLAGLCQLLVPANCASSKTASQLLLTCPGLEMRWQQPQLQLGLWWGISCSWPGHQACGVMGAAGTSTGLEQNPPVPKHHAE